VPLESCKNCSWSDLPVFQIAGRLQLHRNSFRGKLPAAVGFALILL
jgi:hypothetical protein